MTFNQNVKNEILKSIGKPKHCCCTAGLSAFIKGGGSPSSDGRGFTVSIKTAKGMLLPLINTFLNEAKQGAEIKYTDQNSIYLSNARRMLNDCGILSFENGLELVEGVYPPFTQKECCIKTYLICLFLMCGSVSIPLQESAEEQAKRGYHLELVLPSVETALDVVNMFGEFNFDARLSCRGDKQLVYFKDSEEISDLFALFGASKAVFTLQNSKAARSVRAEANRTRNCISANVLRAADSGVRQAECIKKLEQAGELDKLPKELKETALLRKLYPEATLAEMAELHKGNVGKSGINHRLRTLERLAEELK